MFHWKILLFFLCLNYLAVSAQNVSKESQDLGEDLFNAIQSGEFEGLVKYRCLKLETLAVLNSNKNSPLTQEKLNQASKNLPHHLLSSLKNLKSVGSSQSVNWNDVRLAKIGIKEDGGKSTLVLSLSQNKSAYFIKVKNLIKYEGEWMFGLNTEFQWTGTKAQLEQAKGIVKSVFFALRSNEYSSIHSGNLLTEEDMYAIMQARKNGRKENSNEAGGLVNRAAEIMEDEKPQDDPELRAQVQEYRLKYIRGLTQSIQNYYNTGYREKLNWANTKITKLDLDLHLKTRFGLSVGELNFTFSDGDKSFKARIKDCFVINGQLRLGFQLDIELLDPKAIIVNKLMVALNTERFNEMIESLIPGEDLLKLIHKSDAGEVLPQGIEKNFLRGRVDMLNDLRSDFIQVISDGDATNINWEKVRLVDDNYGAQFTKIDDQTKLLHLTFDIQYENVMYIISVENCVVRRGVGYILSNLKFIKLD